MDTAPPGEPESSGISYVLLDQQESAEPRASYYHEAHLITSENGVQNGAALSVDFDPSYQKLVFHFIRLIRAGATINRLDRSQIKLLQREREMESFLYDGSFTAHCELEDVRVGDPVEYAYTIEGANPVMRGRYFDTSATEWNTPVVHAVTRYVFPEKRRLNFRVKGRTIQPTITTQNGTSEWLWDEQNVPARRVDPNTPSTYHPYGSVQVSEFQNWGEVVDWAVPLYQSEAPLSPDFEAEVSRLQALPTADERIRAALRFVQDEIRYLGIESGINSHHPTAPSEVLRRRFGDCKDKTLLLATLLRQCGLKATPALVSTVHHGQIAERLPSPGGFNHVILRVENEDQAWWLDATRSAQRGDLSQIYSSNFGSALLVAPGTRDLVPCQPAPEALPQRKIFEHYRIPAPTGEARLDVTSEFHGLSAEMTRSYFQNNRREEIQKDYLRFYARRYPRIRTAEAIEYAELPGENGCQVKEHYLIPDLWRLNDEQSLYRFGIYPTDVESEMGTPGTTERNDPLAVNYPIHITQEIQVEMFKDWDLKSSQAKVANHFFRYSHEASRTGHNVRLIYAYETLTDRVAPAEVPAYDAALRKLKDGLGYTFSYTTPEQTAAKQKKEQPAVAFQFNWPIAILLGLVVCLVVPFAVHFYRASQLRPPLPPSLTHRSLEGIGGWLIVVALGLFLRPFMFFKANVTLSKSVFSLQTWDTLTHIGGTGYHPLWMPILLFEFIYNSLAFIFCLLLIALFFRRRAIWPRCFAAFFLFMLTGVLVDICLGRQIPAVASNLTGSLSSFGQTLFAAAIWVPYSFTSKRVKATFRY